MMVEAQLQTSLERAAWKSPLPPVDLLDRVDTGYRRRRRTRYTILAAVAVLVVAGAAAFVPRAASTPVVSDSAAPGRSAAPAARWGTEPMVKSAAPAEQVWPQAIHHIPLHSGNGTNLPITMLDEHRMLTQVTTGINKVVALVVYDVRTNTETTIADLPQPAGMRDYWQSGFTVADGIIYWAVNGTRTDGSPVGEYWSVRVDGTGKRCLLSGQHAQGDRIVVADGTLYAANPGQGGFVQMPLTGGTPEIVPGSQGFLIVRWPWATNAAQRGTQQPTAWNVLTGERRAPAPRPGVTPWWTVADQDTWLGLDPDGRTFAAAADGSWSTTTNGFEAQTFNSGWLVGGSLKDPRHPGPRASSPARAPNDREAPAVWDLRTGKVATYGYTDGAGSWTGGNSFAGQPDRPLVWWPAKDDPTRLAVLDPALVT